MAESNLNRQLIALTSTLGRKQGGGDGGARLGFFPVLPRGAIPVFYNEQTGAPL